MSNRKKVKQTNKAFKVFTTILIVILVGALATSVTFNVLQYRKANASDNITTPDTQEPPTDTDTLANENNVIVKPIEPAEPSVALLSLASEEAVTAADDTVDIPVTVTPNIEDNSIKLDWTIKFNNASSTWAKGKEIADYATITPTADGARTANIKVLQAFGEQIIVTATLRSDTAISVSCTVDYAKKYSLNGWVGEEQDNPTYNRQFKMTPQLTTSIGTVDDTITQSITFKAADGWLNFYASHLRNKLISAMNSDVFDQAFDYMRSNVITGTSSIITDYIWLFYDEGRDIFAASYADASEYEILTYRLLGIYLTGFFPQMPWDNYCSSLNALTTAKKNGINNLFNNALTQYGRYWADTMYQVENAFTLTYTLKGAHNSISKTYSIPFLSITLPNYVVSSLEIDPPSIIV